MRVIQEIVIDGLLSKFPDELTTDQTVEAIARMAEALNVGESPVKPTNPKDWGKKAKTAKPLTYQPSRG